MTPEDFIITHNNSGVLNLISMARWPVMKESEDWEDEILESSPTGFRSRPYEPGRSFAQSHSTEKPPNRIHRMKIG